MQAQTEIDPDFSEMMFTYTDETDKSARKRMLEDYWQLKEGSSLQNFKCYAWLRILARSFVSFAVDDDTSESYPAGEYNPNSLLVDQIEAAVSYAVERLFLHYEIYQFISFFNDTLVLMAGEPAAAPPLPLPMQSQVLKQFETSLVPHYSSKITPDNFLDAVEYIKETVFQHLCLYQFLLTQEQPKDVTALHLPIEVLPSESTSLTQGTDEEQWQKRERVEQLKEEYAQREKEMIDSHAKTEIEVQEKLKEVYEVELAKIKGGIGELESKLLTPEEVSEIIGALLTAHMEVLTSTVTHALQRQALAIEARLEKMEVISAKASKLSLSSMASPPKLGPPSPSGKKSRTSSRLSVSTSKN